MSFRTLKFTKTSKVKIDMDMVCLYLFCYFKCSQEQKGNIFTCSVRTVQNRTFFGAERSVLTEHLDPMFPRTLVTTNSITYGFVYLRIEFFEMSIPPCISLIRVYSLFNASLWYVNEHNVPYQLFINSIEYKKLLDTGMLVLYSF